MKVRGNAMEEFKSHTNKSGSYFMERNEWKRGMLNDVSKRSHFISFFSHLKYDVFFLMIAMKRITILFTPTILSTIKWESEVRS